MTKLPKIFKSLLIKALSSIVIYVIFRNSGGILQELSIMIGTRQFLDVCCILRLVISSSVRQNSLCKNALDIRATINLLLNIDLSILSSIVNPGTNASWCQHTEYPISSRGVLITFSAASLSSSANDIKISNSMLSMSSVGVCNMWTT